MLEKELLGAWTDALASKAPVPGGGGASALAGALAAALGQMVANLTVGKKRYADVEEEMQQSLFALNILQMELMALADKDAEVFAPLAAAYGLPSGTEEEQAEKDRIIGGESPGGQPGAYADAGKDLRGAGRGRAFGGEGQPHGRIRRGRGGSDGPGSPLPAR